MPHLELCLLGTYQVTRDSSPITGFAFNKVRGLLAYLALESNRPHAREALAALLWPEASQESALSSLRNALANLRTAIGDRDAAPPYLFITPQTVQFNRASDTHLDVDNLLQMALDIQNPLSRCQPADLERITAAVDHYRGPLLAGFSIPDSAEFEEWASLWRERLARMTLDGLRWLSNEYEVCGEYELALGFARRQVMLEPWLEEGHRQVMRLLALSGQRSEALAHFEICKSILAQELGVEPAEETRRLVELISGGVLETLRPGQMLPAPGKPPYRGLCFFDEADAGFFFGREELVSRLVERLARMVASGACQMMIVGASGSGKSSLIRAGVVPALRKSGWEVQVITPTASPEKVLQELGENWNRKFPLSKQTAHLRLLVIDQFEELFSLCREEREREAFLEQVFSLGFPVLMALRADFYGHCAPYSRLRAVLSEWQEYIGSMNGAALRRAIEEPARLAGWELEPGLADLILRDVGIASGDHPPEPGGLPLLEHALLETWRRRRGRMLTLAGYFESGGVHGAIAQTAERIYSCLSADEQHLARKVFLRLTELGEGTQDTRRRAAFTELHALNIESQVVERLLNVLAEARLVTLGKETAEVAHEALIREWPLLQSWLAEDRDGLRLHRHLTESASAWERMGRDAGDLYRGARLAQALEWAAQGEHRQELTPFEGQFLQAARDQEEREVLEREGQRQRELEAAQRIAEAESRRADTEQQRALEREQAAQQLYREERLAYARELAAHSKNKLTAETDLSLLLALQAVTVLEEAELPISWDVQQAIHDVALASRLLWKRELPALTNVAFYSPDGKWIYFEAYYDNDIKKHALDAETGEEIFSIQADGSGLALSGDGKYLATGSGGRAFLWDALSGQKILTLVNTNAINPAIGGISVFSPDGRYLLVQIDDDTGSLLDLEPWLAAGSPSGVTLNVAGKPVDRSHSYCCAAAFSPDSKTFTTGWDRDSSVILWDAETVQPLRTFMGHTAWTRIDSFSPDGSRLATCGFDNTIRIWEVSSARELLCFTGHSSSIHSVIYSPDGMRLASASNDAFVTLWDAPSGRRLMDIHPGGPAYMAAFHPNGERLFVTTFLGFVSLWDISQRGRGELVTFAHPDPVTDYEVSPDSSLLVEARKDGSIGLVNSSTFREVASVVVADGAYGPILPGLNQDNTRLAVDAGGRISVWDVQTRQLLFDQPAEDGWQTVFAFPPSFSPDGILLVTGGYTGKISVWNLVSGQKQWVFNIRPGSPPKYSQFSPDGRRLAVGCWGTIDSGGGYVWVWDLAEPETSPLLLHTDRYVFNYLCFSPDSRYLACCGNDLESRIWDVASGVIYLVLSGHSGSICSINYSPDGRYLITTSMDGTARVWNAHSGVELLSYRSPNESFPFLAFFTPDGRRVVTCSTDQYYRLLVFAEFDQLLEIVRQRKTRDWKPEERHRYLREENDQLANKET